jgi:hypothetical protein
MKFKFLSDILNWFSIFFGWSKRVFLQDKNATFSHKEKQLNHKFNQYYKLLESFKNYNMISQEEIHKSDTDIRKQHVEEQNQLIKKYLD